MARRERDRPAVGPAFDRGDGRFHIEGDHLRLSIARGSRAEPVQMPAPR